MMLINNCNDVNIKMVRGDTLAFSFEIEELESTLTSAFLTCKKNYDDETLFQKSLSDGITQSEEGLYLVKVDPADTSGLDVGKYRYDLEVTFNGETYTILRGILTLENEVTS